MAKKTASSPRLATLRPSKTTDSPPKCLTSPRNNKKFVMKLTLESDRRVDSFFEGRKRAARYRCSPFFASELKISMRTSLPRVDERWETLDNTVKFRPR